MRRPSTRIFTIVCAQLIALSLIADVAIEERLGREYSPQLMAISGEDYAGDTLVGPTGPVAVQRQGDYIWFITESMQPLQTLTYRAPDKPTPAPRTQLSVMKSRDSVEINTGKIAARFPLGGGDGQPPAPLLGLRIGRDQWSPASEWSDAKPIASWSSELLAEGPVFAEVRTTYKFEDGAFCSFRATLIEGDTAIRWRMASNVKTPDTRLTLHLPAVPNVKTVSLPKGYGQWARDGQAQTSNAADGFIQLSPDTSLLGLFKDHPWHIIFGQGDDSLQLQSSAPGDWVTPGMPQTYYGQEKWTLPMIEAMWAGWRERGLPVVYGKNGSISLLVGCGHGAREWLVSAGPPSVGEEFRRINKMTLAWQESAKHPLLFLDADEVQAISPTMPMARLANQWAAMALANPNRGLKKLRNQLGQLGRYDVMRQGIATATLYDVLIDSPDISEEDRRLFRAQMAYLGYLLADPMCWSSERGYGSGNPNMHVSYILTLGVVACVLRDHPMADPWANYASAWLDHWLDHEVGPGGEWIPEGAHYSNVSLEAIVSFTLASKRAGYRDFTQDQRLKKLLRFFAKINTPPDPIHGGKRATPNYGRGTSGEQLATLGVAARLFAEADPALSSELQWAWAQAGSPTKIGDQRLGGLVSYYVDPQLPQTAPNWGSEQFPQLGAVLRAGFNTPQESYVNFLAGVGSERNMDVWTPSVTDIAQWFARGKPLSSCFVLTNGTRDRHTLLSDGPQLARNYQPGDSGQPFGYYSTTDFSAFAALPGFDYARTSRTNTKPDNRNWLPANLPAYPKLKAAQCTNLTIDRQVALIKEDDAKAPAYLVIRDTTQGGEPTAWQFWTLTEGITAEGQAGQGGEQIRPSKRLPDGDRYAGQGQFGVDVEYFIASPSDTPRHTLRYGGEIIHQKNRQYQDVLHLQRPDDGAYFVAIYPRLPGEAAPEFTTNRSQQIIRVDLPAGGRDYIFLSGQEDRANLDDASFAGTSGAAKIRQNDRYLALGGPGQVTLGDLELKSDCAAALRLEGGRLYVNTAADSPGGSLELRAPGAWSRVKALHGPGGFKGHIQVDLPAGVNELIYETK